MSDATAKRPQRADAVRNHARLLQAANEVFAQRGVGVTLDDVARHAGVGVGTVYRHFPGKDELINAVFELNFAAMADAAEEAAAGEDPWRALVEYLEFACERMAGSRGMTEVLHRGGCEQVAAQHLRIEAAVATLLQRAQSSGALRPDAHPDDFFSIIFSTGALADATRQINPDAWRRQLALLLDGLNSDHRPRRPLPRRHCGNHEFDTQKTQLDP
ncbi:TetR/AcrR family transcriptional regulator [Mycobacteriaceae bacterium NPDC060252]